MALIAAAAMTVAACGDESEPAADSGDQQTISSGGSGGSNPPAVRNLAPWISGSPSRKAMADEQYAFRPGAGDPEGDPLSFRAINLPRWAVFNASSGRLYGTPSAADVGSYSNIDIEVTDGDRTSRLGSFTIEVVATASGSITISWLPATERTDGSPLTNIEGTRIHWGTAPETYSSSVLVSGGATAYVIDNLLPASYYIAASTVDANGLESDLSDPVTISLQ
jgi:hypothetical protein